MQTGIPAQTKQVASFNLPEKRQMTNLSQSHKQSF